MKLALLSDIHANVQALDACLAHSRLQGAKQWAFLGDLVGYGGDPVAVLDQIQRLVGHGAWVVQGNHDAMAVSPPQNSERLGEITARWTHNQLSPAHRHFLANLPLTVAWEGVYLVHASAEEPSKWRYVEDTRGALASLNGATTAQPETRHVFGGHVHQQTLYYRGGRQRLMPFTPTPGVPIHTPVHRHWIATVGSVGQPRDGKPLAMYAMFDATQKKLTFHRVPYDHMGAAAAVRRAGLPDYFAQRLEEGR